MRKEVHVCWITSPLALAVAGILIKLGMNSIERKAQVIYIPEKFMWDQISLSFSVIPSYEVQNIYKWLLFRQTIISFSFL